MRGNSGNKKEGIIYSSYHATRLWRLLFYRNYDTTTIVLLLLIP